MHSSRRLMGAIIGLALLAGCGQAGGQQSLYYDIEVVLAKNNVKGPIGNYGPQQGISWNIYEWEISQLS